MTKLQVGVVFGGRSVEHEVSIISALQALRVLDRERYQPVPVYISKQGAWYCGEALEQLKNYQNMETLLARCTPVYFSPNYGDWQLTSTAKSGLFGKPWRQRLDVMLPVIHGTHGEDGCLQGLLQLSGIPFVGPAVLGAACGMDKIIMKSALAAAGLPVVHSCWFTRADWQSDREATLQHVESDLRYPLVVKPANLGSSIGISRVNDREELAEAVDLAVSFAARIVVEQAVEPLRELNCAVLGTPQQMQVSAIEEPLAESELLSFQDKYLSNAKGSGKGMEGAKRRIPADIPPELAAHVEELARRSFAVLDGHGVCRVDFLLNSKSGQLYVNELNTIPGSLSFYLFEPLGKSFTTLLDELIQLALERYRVQEKTLYIYNSNILAQGGFKGKK